jgi:hypothetical protein
VCREEETVKTDVKTIVKKTVKKSVSQRGTSCEVGTELHRFPRRLTPVFTSYFRTFFTPLALRDSPAAAAMGG